MGHALVEGQLEQLRRACDARRENTGQVSLSIERALLSGHALSGIMLEELRQARATEVRILERATRAKSAASSVAARAAQAAEAQAQAQAQAQAAEEATQVPRRIELALLAGHALSHDDLEHLRRRPFESAGAVEESKPSWVR